MRQVLGDKVIKRNKRNKIKLIPEYCLRNKSVGIIEENPEKGLVKYAKPVSYRFLLGSYYKPMFNTGTRLVRRYQGKRRNDSLPLHPRAKVVTINVLISSAMVREGAPAEVIQGIKEPSISSDQ